MSRVRFTPIFLLGVSVAALAAITATVIATFEKLQPNAGWIVGSVAIAAAIELLRNIGTDGLEQLPEATPTRIVLSHLDGPNAFAGAPGAIEITAVACAKRGASIDESEDAWAAKQEAGRAAISDGASSAYMSREWAQALVEVAVNNPVCDAPGALQELRNAAAIKWESAARGSGETDWLSDAASQRGSFATLATVEVAQNDGKLTWRASTVGDSCVARLTKDSSQRFVCTEMFPHASAADFEATPQLIATDPAGSEFLGIRTIAGSCSPGDVILLMTDAIACCAIASDSAGVPIWDWLVGADQQLFSENVTQLRSSGALVDDDTTVVRVELS